MKIAKAPFDMKDHIFMQSISLEVCCENNVTNRKSNCGCFLE